MKHIFFISSSFILLFCHSLILVDTAFSAPSSSLKLPSALSSQESLEKQLREADKKTFIEVKEIGKSIQNRSIFLVKASHAAHIKRPFRILFYAQQHGDEPAGKDALLALLKDITNHPQKLPSHVELYIIPQMNPDGASAKKRQNAHGADLNRDHQILSQPETRILHRIVRVIRPHLAVDCHEFDRTSKEYLERGWIEWPDIMVDTANHPFLPEVIYRQGLRWLDALDKRVTRAGYNFSRYYVGGVPPEDELRHSTLEIDDGRNSLAMEGMLSFIVESGVDRRDHRPHTDLPRRIGAYLAVLHTFLAESRLQMQTQKELARSVQKDLPAFIPTNVFWANSSPDPKVVRVIEEKTGKVSKIYTANFMTERVMKHSVPTPKGYIIPDASAKKYKLLLERHGITFQSLPKSVTFPVETCRLARIEKNYDTLYNRYENRQIVTCRSRQPKRFEKGSLVVRLSGTAMAKGALVLEPGMLFGLYQWPTFRKTIGKDKVIPVFRWVDVR